MGLRFKYQNNANLAGATDANHYMLPPFHNFIVNIYSDNAIRPIGHVLLFQLLETIYRSFC